MSAVAGVCVAVSVTAAVAVSVGMSVLVALAVAEAARVGVAVCAGVEVGVGLEVGTLVLMISRGTVSSWAGLSAGARTSPPASKKAVVEIVTARAAIRDKIIPRGTPCLSGR